MAGNVLGLRAGGELGAINELIRKNMLVLTIFPEAQFHRLRVARVMHGLYFSPAKAKVHFP